MDIKQHRRALGALLPLVAIGLAAASATTSKPVRAEGEAERAERCGIRLSAAILGTSADAALLSNANPQATVDDMLKKPEFQERFSRFINARFNREPGMNSLEDVTYHLSKYLLENDKPWRELYLGQYDITQPQGGQPTVSVDPNGMGYFRTTAWMQRYAGNEGTQQSGYRIVSGYQYLQNTTGLVLQAITAVDGLDLSATGRQAPACRGCHYEKWSGLDKVAKLLSKRRGTGNNMTFDPPAASEGPQQVANTTITPGPDSDKELMTKLVDSTDFKVWTCRTAFNYLYGRDENVCEASTFERCMAVVEGDPNFKIQAAIAAIAKDPAYCQ